MPKSCRQQARAVEGVPEVLIWGIATRVDFRRALVYSRCGRHALHVSRTRGTKAAENKSVRKQLTFNLGADLPENTFHCLKAVVWDPGSSRRPLSALRRLPRWPWLRRPSLAAALCTHAPSSGQWQRLCDSLTSCWPLSTNPGLCCTPTDVDTAAASVGFPPRPGPFHGPGRAGVSRAHSQALIPIMQTIKNLRRTVFYNLILK